MLQALQPVVGVGTQPWGVGELTLDSTRDLPDHREATPEATLLHPSAIALAMLGHEGISWILVD
jgi:hypothetical protein